MLSLVMLINRSGAMVIPFLSIYLTEKIGLSKVEAGYVLMGYGVGAVIGTTLGGQLTERFGHYKVQAGSLIATGVYLFILPLLSSFVGLIVGVTTLSIIADTIRPANGASIGYYAKKENVTKAFSLNRLAINLGISIGPSIGGWLATFSYTLLFITDGTTCILAGIAFILYFRNLRKGEDADREERKKSSVPVRKAYTDIPFVLFCILNACFALVFFQILYTLPLFYVEEYAVDTTFVGYMLALNGLVVFAFEMIVVHLWGHKFKVMTFVIFGAALNGLAYLMLIFTHSNALLITSMVLLSFAEIFAMPFAIAWVSNRAGEASRGSYMGLYTSSYAVAHIIAPLAGTQLITYGGFDLLYGVLGGFGLLTALGFYGIVRAVNKPTLLQEDT
ncbi:MFS transporter [Phaeocystidibacter marisrubri]|uniref:MFS transporter n=2 Tax=Phaeocystidibacter marisrubri TaxID=1577780 RepID=A0A6L3ZFX3_9FLAO|nr:MFS transporter [Phaeocystidibacter marisrubri]